MRLRIWYSGTFALLSVFIIFFSCSRQAEETDIPRTAVSSEPAISDTGNESAPLRALVTFLTGEVILSGSGGDRTLEIGDYIDAGDELRTGADSYVELQFGTLGVLRIQAESSYRLDVAELEEDREQVSGFLGAGSIVAKIRHLTKRDGFEVNVAGAVCAVRGTEFLIRSDERGAVTIAVADGAVTVSPPSMAEVGRYNEVSGTKEEPVDELSGIRQLMPLVTADREMVITAETLAGLENELAVFLETSDDSNAESSEPQINQLESRIENLIADVPVPESISAVNAEVLDTETPEILDISYETDSSETEAPPDLVTLSVTAEPEGSRIFINNRPAGVDRTSGVYSRGSELSVLVVSPDGRRMEKLLTAGSESEINFNLNDEESPEGSGETIQAEVSEVDPPLRSGIPDAGDGGLDSSAAGPDASDLRIPATVSQNTVQEKMVFQVRSQPEDAVVSFNGRTSGTGSGEYSGKPGDQLSVKVERPGYVDFSRTVSLNPSAPVLDVRLEPRLIVGKSALKDTPAVGSLVSNGAITVGATGQGSVFAVDRSGTILWTRATENRDAENSTPVISSNRVYLTGSRELVILDISDGSLVGRRSLDGDEADLFGRRVLPWNKFLILPSDSALIFVNPGNGTDNGKSADRIIIPGGSRMTPVLWDNQIIIADQRGTLLYIDPVSKSITNQVPTASTQPIGQAPVIRGDTAVLSGRRGEVSAVNLRRGELLWEHPLSEEKSVSVHTDVLIGNRIVYVYGSHKLYSLSLRDGGRVFPPIDSVSAAPQIINGILYLCRDDGSITMHNPVDGSLIGAFSLGETSRVRPAGIGDFIVAATDHNVFVLDPRSITE